MRFLPFLISLSALAADIPPERLMGRKGLLQDMDRVRRTADAIATDGRDAAYQRAYNVLTFPKVMECINLQMQD